MTQIFVVEQNRTMMAQFRMLCLLCITSFASVWGGNARAQSASSDEVVFWPRRDFIIPFQVDLTGESPSEIQLEVSDDRGRSWSLYTRSDVRGKQFNFHSYTDGEYYFRLKTLDQSGHTFENPGEPLKVIVDTVKPTGELRIDMTEKGQLQADFQLSDDAIDERTIRLEYQSNLISNWQEIPIEIVPSNVAQRCSGRALWTIANQTQQVLVRVTVKDRAGNLLEITRMPQLPRSAQAPNANMKLASNQGQSAVPIGSGVKNAPPKPAKNASNVPKIEVLGGPGAKSPTQLQDTEIAAKEKMLLEKERFIELQNRFIAQQQTLSHLNLNQSDGPSNPGGIPVPTVDEYSRNQTRTNANGITVRPLSQDELEHLNSKPNSSRSTANTLTDEPKSLVDHAPSPAGQLDRGSRNSNEPRNQVAPKSEQINSLSNARPHQQPLFSKSKTFSLDYAIENDPGAPISSVELWATDDGGDHWELWGTDPDNASPFDIAVRYEGLYGFRMVIVGANGLASHRPRNGDDADAWIHVDLKEPFGRLTAATYGKGEEAGSLVIEYQANDEYFPDRPISFFYSESPKGPWTRIASGVRNNGRYLWQTDPSLPPKVYLRLEAMDAAGNVGISQLDIPVDIQGLAPRGRIQGFRPISE